MPLYLSKFSYTPETWARLIRNPEDRRKAAQSYIESVGGKLLGFWYAFGAHDGTLESLEGLRAPSAGMVRVAGIDPTREAARLRNVIGVQLQSAGLPKSITADEAMKFFCAYHGVAPRFDLLERLGEKRARRQELLAELAGEISGDEFDQWVKPERMV